MFIKDIIIDGFKSYAVKTSVSGFDPQFNAITGLNGSGKSNILDAICFVMGITSLSHMRATNLQELIFKYGQANVTKAVVSIVFDNTDKQKSPLGFVDCDELVFTRTIQAGKSKYFVNGYTSTQENVRSLFQSVQLNINNPHFLIMQGKVMQVVNMKPLEILGLLEEAAGTSIFQSKKEASLKMIAKKDSKVQEINTIIQEEITPQLERLRRDKETYMEWKANENEILNLTKKTVAYKWYHMGRAIENKERENSDINLEIENLTELSANLNKELEAISRELEELESKLDLGKGTELYNLREQKKKLETELKIAKKMLLNVINELKNNKKAIMKRESDCNVTSMNLTSNVAKLEEFEKRKEILAAEIETKEKELLETEINLDNLNQGKLNKEQVINQQKQRIARIEAELERKQLEKEDYQRKLKDMCEDKKYKEEEITKLKKRQAAQEREASSEDQIAVLEEKLKSLKEITLKKNFFEKNIDECNETMRYLDRQRGELNGKYGYKIAVKYRDPEPNFNRSRVFGRVINLIKVKDPKYITALEFVAGGKLFNYVTDNEITSKLLIQRKCFDQMTSIIPNSAVKPRTVPFNKVEKAKQMSNNQCFLAIELVEYDPVLQKTMEFVFGNTLVCTNKVVATQLAFDKNIYVKCITLMGEVFEPAGMMSGGGTGSNESLLQKASEMHNIMDQLKEENSKVKLYEQELNFIHEKLKEQNEISFNLENLRNKNGIGGVERALQMASELKNQVSELEEAIKRQETAISQMNDDENELSDRLKAGQLQLKDIEKGKNNVIA